jgi:hypothetical protein
MVMRNRHEGSGAPHWWDDLPPHVRGRFSLPPAPGAAEPEAEDAPLIQPRYEPRPFSGTDLIIDLSRFAMVFVLIAIVILLYLLAALTYIQG